MKKIYTCYVCAFPFATEEEACPETCPSCGAHKDQFLSEPWTDGGIEARRIHVDPPKADTDRDPFDVGYHVPKHFPAHTRNGRIRRFVFSYDDAKQAREFYETMFGWDIINTEHSDEENPLMFCATGPGNPNWEPKFPSFGYGYLKSKSSDTTGKLPNFMVEVDSIADTLKAVVKFGGKVLKEQYESEGQLYAVVEDTEGNAMYLWQTPATVTWDEPESQTV